MSRVRASTANVLKCWKVAVVDSEYYWFVLGRSN